MGDRYADIESTADLGGTEMFPDLTEDLRKQETRDDGAPTPDVTTGSNPTTL